MITIIVPWYVSNYYYKKSVWKWILFNSRKNNYALLKKDAQFIIIVHLVNYKLNNNSQPKCIFFKGVERLSAIK